MSFLNLPASLRCLLLGCLLLLAAGCSNPLRRTKASPPPPGPVPARIPDRPIQQPPVKATNLPEPPPLPADPKPAPTKTSTVVAATAPIPKAKKPKQAPKARKVAKVRKPSSSAPAESASAAGNASSAGNNPADPTAEGTGNPASGTANGAASTAAASNAASNAAAPTSVAATTAASGPGTSPNAAEAPAPTFTLGAIVSPQERLTLQRQTEQLLAACEQAINSANGKTLNGRQVELLGRIRTFVTQAKDAQDRNPADAKRLAERGKLFADRLAEELR